MCVFFNYFYNILLFLNFFFFFFFFNDTATTEIYTLSLHDALPTSRIWTASSSRRSGVSSLESARPSIGQSAGRITAAATSGPASAPRPASSTPATRAKPTLRSRSSRMAVASTSESQDGSALLVTPQPARVAERPDADEGTAHQGRAVDRSEGTRVLGVVAIVPHHEELASRHGGRRAVLGGRAGRQVGLVHRPAVAVQPALLAGDAVAGCADHTFDEVAVGRRRDPDRLPEAGEEPGHRVARFGLRAGQVVDEDDHVAVLHLAEPVGDLLDQHPVGDVQRWLHGAGGDVERLHQERLEEHRQQDGEHHQDGGLAHHRERALLGLAAVLGGLVTVRGTGGAGDVGALADRAVVFGFW